MNTTRRKNRIKSFVITAAAILALFVIAFFFIIPKAKNRYLEKQAEKIVTQMSVDEKIGQIMMPSFWTWIDHPGGEEQDVTELNDEIRDMISDFHLGGIAVFSENSTDISQLVHLTYDMQHAAIDSGNLPLLISADQEGGNVSRAKYGTLFSGNMALGASGNTDYANTAGKIIGKELDALGINCNAAPDADVNSNEQNPVIGIRSFGGDADIVSKMSIAMAKGLESSNVVSCAKHFPGHGDTSTDSHTGLSMVSKNYDEWLSSDGKPFRDIIRAKATDMIMTAHLQYPGLDDTTYYSPKENKEIIVPATMSKKILTEILREDLGFEGVIITDAMDMGAIVNYFGVHEATIKSIEAGADIILMPVNPICSDDRKELDSLFSDIKTALADGRITEERLNDAVTHVVKLKIDKGIIGKDYNIDPDDAAEKAKAIVGCPEHRDIERKIALKCVNISYNGEFKAFSPNRSDKVVCIMPRPKDMYSAEHSIIKMKEKGIIADVDAKYYNIEEYYDSDENKELDPQMLKDVEEADYVIMGYYQSAEYLNDPNNKFSIVFDEILEYATTDKVAIMWERLPYKTEKYADKYPCILLYNSEGMTEADIGKDTFSDVYGCAIPAGFEILFGVKP